MLLDYIFLFNISFGYDKTLLTLPDFIPLFCWVRVAIFSFLCLCHCHVHVYTSVSMSLPCPCIYFCVHVHVDTLALLG
jgi:hypothetical protein